MNIKELVYKISYKKVFNEIYKYYLQNRSDDSVTDLDRCMYLAWNNLSKTEYKKSDDEEVEFDKTLRIELSWPPNEPYTNRLLKGNVIYFEKGI